MNARIDMFGAPPLDDTTLVGVAITLPEQCPRCNGRDAVIGAGRIHVPSAKAWLMRQLRGANPERRARRRWP